MREGAAANRKSVHQTDLIPVVRAVLAADVDVLDRALADNAVGVRVERLEPDVAELVPMQELVVGEGRTRDPEGCHKASDQGAQKNQTSHLYLSSGVHDARLWKGWIIRKTQPFPQDLRRKLPVPSPADFCGGAARVPPRLRA